MDYNQPIAMRKTSKKLGAPRRIDYYLILRLYIDGKSIIDIAKEVNATKSWVYRVLKKYGRTRKQLGDDSWMKKI